MNVQERDQLLQFFSSLQRTPVQPRDPVAEELIRQALADGISPYDLVQRAMGLTLALQAAQVRVADLEARCAALVAQKTSPSSMTPDASAPPSAVSAPQAGTDVWRQGVLRQAAGTALGVAAGVVAGGLLLEGWQRTLGGDAIDVSAGDRGLSLWDLGEDGA